MCIRDSSSTGYSIDLKRYGTRDWGWYMAFGILAILCSLLILWQPAIGALYACLLYTSNKEQVSPLIQFILSSDGQDIIKKSGYIPVK